MPLHMPTIGLSFVRVLSIVNEFARITGIVDFRPPPPEYTFRGLEPVVYSAIEHYQARCERKHAEITGVKAKRAEDGGPGGGVSPLDLEQRYDELEILLGKYSHLLNNLSSQLRRPHIAPPRPKRDSELNDLDAQLGPRRYIEQPYQGYGFSNDSIRQWLAAIPGRVGQHFENEESGSVNLTTLCGHVALALIGGAGLLGPMILMEFYTSRNVRLIVVSVATMLFGIVFGVVSSSKENILAGTAAYAAVMVVYVGSAGPSS